MKILSNGGVTPNRYSLNVDSQYKTNTVVKPASLSYNAVSFKKNQVFPFEHLGLKLSRLQANEIKKLLHHVQYVINDCKQSSSTSNNPTQSLKNIIKDKNAILHIVKDKKGKIVGSGFLRCERGEAYLSHLYINPQWQKKGLGTWIVKDLLVAGERKQVKNSSLIVENPIAKNLYKSFGFEKVCKFDDKKIMMMQGKIPIKYKLLKYIPERFQKEIFNIFF